MRKWRAYIIQRLHTPMTGINLHLDDTLGCLFIGAVFALILFSCTCAQVLYYAREYPKDRTRVKMLVAVLWLFDTAATFVDVVILWHYLIHGHGNVIDLTILFKTASSEYALAVPTVFLVQGYYIFTIFILLRGRWYKLPLTGFMTVLALTSCALGFVNVYNGVHEPSFPDVFIGPKVPAILQTSTASLTDVLATVSLTWALNGEKSPISHTATIVRKLSVYAINRGILTTVVQTSQTIVYAALPKTSLYWVIFHLPGSKIYVNSFLAVLNARHSLEGNTDHFSHGFSVDIPLERISTEDQSSFRTDQSKRADRGNVHPRVGNQFPSEAPGGDRSNGAST